MSQIAENSIEQTTKNNAENNSVKQEILTELNNLGSGGPWLWKVFILCLTPGIFNGLHVSSYVFLGQQPDDYWCINSQLEEAGWDIYQIKNISLNDPTTEKNCRILNWEYDKLASMSYSDAVMYTQSIQKPNTIQCKSKSSNYFHYVFDQDGEVSIVSEWDLICDRSVWRTTVQVALSFGKFLGAFVFGIVADKYGRKTAFSIGAVLYIISGPMASVGNSYWLFLIARVCIGIAGSGVYHSAYTILTEVTAIQHRSWTSILFSVSYPIGMIILSFCAYIVRPWRYLQLTLSLPAILLLIHCYYLIESPRWLINKHREKKAYKIVFPKRYRKFEDTHDDVDTIEEKKSLVFKLKRSMKELILLYGPPEFRKNLLICHLTWGITSLSYYAIALNADNFDANRYLYVAITGFVEVPSYILPIIILRYTGRKVTSLILFIIAGVSLLIIIAIPEDKTTVIITIAMFGRLCISAVFAVIILHTAELFPTEIRNSAIGTSSTMAHVGSISAPYIVDFLGDIAWFIPTTICGAGALLAGVSVMFLPETRNKALNDTAEEELHH